MTIPKITQSHLDAAYDLPENAKSLLDLINTVNQIAIAEQQESKYITTAQARELGAGNAEWKCNRDNAPWNICTIENCEYAKGYLYRAIKQAQPEPVIAALEEINKRIDKNLEEFHNDEAISPELEGLAEKAIAKLNSERADPHAALRAEYAKQLAEGTTGFYLWEYKDWNGHGHQIVGKPDFLNGIDYRCTDISCLVSKDGEPAIRMMRTDAQALQAKLGDTVEWETPKGYHCRCEFNFDKKRTYNYRTKATIKLDGKMVTREQAAAEWESKKETCDCWYRSNADNFFSAQDTNFRWNIHNSAGREYELRTKALKQVKWECSHEDAIALLKEKGLL